MHFASVFIDDFNNCHELSIKNKLFAVNDDKINGIEYTLEMQWIEIFFFCPCQGNCSVLGPLLHSGLLLSS